LRGIRQIYSEDTNMCCSPECHVKDFQCYKKFSEQEVAVRCQGTDCRGCRTHLTLYEMFDDRYAVLEAFHDSPFYGIIRKTTLDLVNHHPDLLTAALQVADGARLCQEMLNDAKRKIGLNISEWRCEPAELKVQPFGETNGNVDYSTEELHERLRKAEVKVEYLVNTETGRKLRSPRLMIVALNRYFKALGKPDLIAYHSLLGFPLTFPRRLCLGSFPGCMMTYMYDHKDSTTNGLGSNFDDMSLVSTYTFFDDNYEAISSNESTGRYLNNYDDFKKCYGGCKHFWDECRSTL